MEVQFEYQKVKEFNSKLLVSTLGFNSFSTYMQYIENGGVQLQCPYFPTPQNLE